MLNNLDSKPQNPQVAMESCATRLLSIVTHVEFLSKSRSAQRKYLLEEMAFQSGCCVLMWRAGLGKWLPEVHPNAVWDYMVVTESPHDEVLYTITQTPLAYEIRKPLAESLANSCLAVATRVSHCDIMTWKRKIAESTACSRFRWMDWITAVRPTVCGGWTEMMILWDLASDRNYECGNSIVNVVLNNVGLFQPYVEHDSASTIEADLGNRHRAVLRLLLQGNTRKEIASALGISTHTVNDYCKHIYARFEVNSATELAARFLKLR